ncbi:unnamed protein product [Spirodela intermedia]|uniref:Uncharacterized protein n=1 Tax=Spirodela intermedia TaxID=51605 RepID=A0A7I8JD49_SPIIN|nr:unnamed protein product [Spirodela intermedia]CAA6668070.1 unnamed protein product [Spirodela intermedia]
MTMDEIKKDRRGNTISTEIALLVIEEGLKNLHHLIDVRLIDVHALNRRERLNNALLDVIEHSSDNGQVDL